MTTKKISDTISNPEISTDNLLDYHKIADEYASKLNLLELHQQYQDILSDENTNSYQDAFFHLRRKILNDIIYKYNILDKEEEAIWFVNNSVIKFSTDKNFIANRLQRTKQLGDFIPRIADSSENMYKYNWIEGEVLSKNPTLNKFKQFLEWIENLWQPISLSSNEEEKYHNLCIEFYKNKTLFNA